MGSHNKKSGTGLLPLLLAYALIVLYFGTDRARRKGNAAKSLQSRASDRGSTELISRAFGAAVPALLAAPLLNGRQIGRLRPSLAWCGLAIAGCGMGLRSWANRSLGEYYTRTLRQAEAQHLVRHGPYRVVRHPGYLGSILLWVGSGLASANGPVAGFVAAVMLYAYVYRIQVEEAMLADAFGREYREYARHTWRVIPFIY